MLALSAAANVHAGSHVWSGAGANANFSTAANWASGGVPAAREANVILVFPLLAANRSPIQNIASLGIDQIVVHGDGYTFGASAGNDYFLRGTAAVDLENNTSSATVFTAPVVLNGGEVVVHGTNGAVTFSGVLSGSGALRIDGPTVELGGTAANTYAGATTLQDGLLHLSKPSGVTAVPGALHIGHPVAGSPFPLDDVILDAPNQIADGAEVTIHRSGRLLLDGQGETIGTLEMTGGSVETGFGQLTLGGNVHVSAPSLEFAAIGGNLSLGSQSRVFDVDAGCHLRVSAAISGAAGVGFTKQGPGSMELYDRPNSYGGLTTVANGRLSAYGANATFGTTAAGTVVSAGATLQLSWADIGNEPLQLNGDVPGVPGADGAVFVAHGSSSWAGPVSLPGDVTNTIHVLTVDMTFSGVISGPGSLRLIGELVNGNYTSCILAGAGANTSSGRTLVELGDLELNKTAGVNAVAGPLFVGHEIPGGASTDCRVVLRASNQIVDSAPVNVRHAGVLNAATFDEAIASLDLDGGAVMSTSGTVTLLGNVTNRGLVNDGATAFISGRLSLGSQTRTFDCLSGSYLFVVAQISGGAGAGVLKTGPAILALAGTNTYSGVTTVAAGGLYLYSDQALGSTAAGTVVAPDCLVYLSAVDVGNEPLQLNGGQFSGQLASDGTASWAGPITLNAAGEQSFYPRNGQMTLSGAISGPGRLRVVTENAKVVLSGPAANTHTGGTLVYSGELVLAKNPGVTAIPGDLSIGLNQLPAFPTSIVLSNDHQIANIAAVTLWPNSRLNLNNHSETIGSLGGTGEVETQFATLTTGGNNFTTTFAGELLGVGFVPLVKEGTGTMMVTGTNFSTGRTLVNNGRLLVHGSFAGPVWVSGAATLGGNGVVGTVAGTNGVVSPGAGPGRLNTRNVTLDAASTFRCELNGTSPGVNYDQLRATGAVILAGCTLEVTLGFASASGDQFTLIDNDGIDPVVGAFAGLPQGAQVTLNGQKFSLSYTGGDGNDVVLSHVNTPPSLSEINATPYADEGGTVHINGVVNDPDAGDAFTLTVDWGDGSAPQAFPLAAGTFSFHVDHIYADDKPGANASDSFTIHYTLTDTSGSPTLGNLNVVIGNVAPSFPQFGAVGVKTGEALVTTLTFSDPGADVWSASVDYGDGTGPQSIGVGPNRSVPIQHVFPTNGVYQVKVNASDDDTGTGTATLKVVVGLQLEIARRNAGNIVLSWPAIFPDATVQESPALPGGESWTSVAAAPALLNGKWTVTLPAADAAKFYRLIVTDAP